MQVQTNNLELELMLACARWPQRDSDRQLISDLAENVKDWRRFGLLTKHHRIVPLVSRNLQSALNTSASSRAQPAVTELKDASANMAMRSLVLLSELRRVMVALRASGIAVRVLKGFPLAQLVYGDIGLRAPGDLDLLIESSHLLTADEVIRGLGYTGLLDPRRFNRRQLAFYRTHWKDITYTNPAFGNELDLHWRCFRNPRMPGATLCSAGSAETLTFGDLTLNTLPSREGLLYLCVHGALDGWVYLKTLADVAAQVRELPESELDSLATLAMEHQVLPEFSAAMLLVRRFLGLDHWSRRLLPEGNPTVGHILRYASNVLESRGFMASREEISVGQTLRFEWGLRRSIPYRIQILSRVLYRARMWETLPLPEWLFWAYPLLSPLEWVLFRVRERRPNRSGLDGRNV